MVQFLSLNSCFVFTLKVKQCSDLGRLLRPPVSQGWLLERRTAGAAARACSWGQAGVPDHISQKEALEKNFRKGELKVTAFFEMGSEIWSKGRRSFSPSLQESKCLISFLTRTIGIIQREETSMEEEIAGQCQGRFNLADVMYFSKKGCEAVAEDEVTRRFSSEELVSWNLLSRTNANLHHVSWQLAVVWVIGILIRYCLLMPFRVCLAVFSILLLVSATTVVGQFPNGRVKCWLSNQVQMICATLGVRCLSGLVHFHNRENRPQEGGICVANHTSPLDVLILASDGCYSLVGQAHGGLLGLIQKSCMQTTQHVLFERSEMKDRHLVRKKIREHIADKAKLPILIFPEGTCINNTSVMMFKKGSFEVGGTIHPVAIKYDPRFGDAFWNSTKYSMMTYIFNVMTSWAIVCNVWYLPPMVKEEEEDAVHFANRVKAVIAARGGMSVLPWDGGLKRKKVKESFKEEQQKKYCQIVIENGSVGNGNVC